MVQFEDSQLDLVFAALADSTRRSVLRQLESGASTVTELAQPHGMSLTGFMKHLAVLEAAGLIARSKEGRVVSCELDATPLQDAAMFIARYGRFWTERLDALEAALRADDAVQAAKEKSKLPPKPRRKK